MLFKELTREEDLEISRSAKVRAPASASARVPELSEEQRKKKL